jgi:hypothetical protein
MKGWGSTPRTPRRLKQLKGLPRIGRLVVFGPRMHWIVGASAGAAVLAE